MKKILHCLMFICLLLQTMNVNAIIKKVDYSRKSNTINKFEIIDITFKTKTNIKNPFDIKFNALFTSPSGKTQLIPAFFNGSGQWIVRFSSNENGKWNYLIDSDIKSFNNKKGNIIVSSTAYNNRKGSIVKSKENPQHFVWEDGSPYFMMGFEFDFMFALDYENNQDTPRLNHFLDKVQENNFNHIVMNVYANDVVWKKDPKLKTFPQYEFGNLENIFPFKGNNQNPDHSSLNVEFFQKFDRTMESLNDRNIISHLMIYVWNKAVKWAEYGSANDNRYFDYVIKRYQAFSNVVWDISKEAILYGNIKDDYIIERIDRVKKLDSYKRLVTVHDAGFCTRNKNAVDFFSRQDWKLQTYDEMLKSYKAYPNKPVFNIEHGGYEKSDFHVFCGNYDNAEMCLRRNYESLFAGVYSTYYWQGCSWNVIIYDWDTNPNVKYRPKFEYFKHLTDFFTKYPYHKYKPMPEHNNSAYCMGDNNGNYLFYLQKGVFRVAMNKITKDSKSCTYQWFNTRTGEYTTAKTVKKLEMFNMPSPPWYLQDDCILILNVEKK